MRFDDIPYSHLPRDSRQFFNIKNLHINQKQRVMLICIIPWVSKLTLKGLIFFSVAGVWPASLDTGFINQSQLFHFELLKLLPFLENLLRRVLNLIQLN